MKRIWLIVILLPLFVSLMNSPVYGSPSLTAWFFYMQFSGFVAVLFFTKNILYVGRFFKLEFYIWIFLAFCVYVFLHGIVTGTMSFTHYYWAANAFLILSYCVLLIKNPKYFVKGFYIGITVFALFESIVVLLQCIGILPPKNDSFLCTGTWVNPNVTAIFLALSLFAVLQVFKSLNRPVLTAILLLFIFSAILLLYCRTAHVVSLIFIIGHFKEKIKSFWKTRLTFSTNTIGLIAFLLIGLLVFLSPFLKKQASMEARINIWQNSIRLAAQEPITGFGFGRFEKEYNLFAALQKNPDNGHINMAYNDFLELAIEGGLPAAFLWVLFLFLFAKFCIRNNHSVLPVVAMFVIQLTNFGFQAIPVVALFLIYVATGNADINFWKEEKVGISINSESRKANAKFAYLLIIICSVFLSIKTVNFSGAYYQQNRIHSFLKDPSSVYLFQKLQPVLSFSSSYHENFGDAYMVKRQIAPAIQQYRQALQTCSQPNVFAKCGLCFLVLRQYDSSEYYYQMVQDIEPRRVIPRLALLQLYQQKKDTTQIIKKAKEIIEMPLWVASKKAIQIKEYAKKMIEKIDSINKSEKEMIQIVKPIL